MAGKQTDPQRYTCLEPHKLYRYESLDSDFTRDITVDENDLVIEYPGLFRRVWRIRALIPPFFLHNGMVVLNRNNRKGTFHEYTYL